MLIVENEWHMFSLHFVFLPRLNRDLEVFRNQWNNHPLRTEHNLTPIQLYIQGICTASQSNFMFMPGTRTTEENVNNSRAGNEDYIDDELENNESTVPQTTSPLCDTLMSQLRYEIALCRRVVMSMELTCIIEFLY